MKQIREYRVIEKLGEGGMGEVYLAEDENLGRQVAIKMLAPELMRNAELVERFKQEARLQASLIHPNIVALHTFFVENGIFYMVMEYAQGETLSQRLRRVGLLPPHICIPIFIQILNAVGFAHSKDIIHRDLKPSNIMVDINNNIKIMDFGIAKALGNNNITKTGTKMGTVNYMSPEQIVGDRDIDKRSDIYSLGIVFFEMLTGKLPYNNTTSSEFLMMQEIVQSKLPSVKDFYPYVPDKVDTAISIATQKSRGDRFDSCNEFIEFFENENEEVNNVKVSNLKTNIGTSYNSKVNIIDNIHKKNDNLVIHETKNDLFTENLINELMNFNVENSKLKEKTALIKKIESEISKMPQNLKYKIRNEMKDGVTKLGCGYYIMFVIPISLFVGFLFPIGLVLAFFADRFVKNQQQKRKIINIMGAIDKYNRGLL
jgi:serine/threonine protein kinase